MMNQSTAGGRTAYVFAAALASIAWLATSTPATAISVNNVSSIHITNQSPDGWYYSEEYTIPNAGGTDVASQGFGSTASGDFGTGFGSSINGAINDAISGCCGNGTHSNSNNSGRGGQVYQINLPAAQSFNLNDASTSMRVDDRQDSTCCTGRAFNFAMHLRDAGGQTIATRTFAMSDFALTGTGSTGVPRFGTVDLDGFQFNVAPGKQVVGASSAINNPDVIDNGDTGNTVNDAMFISNIATIPQGFGYDLGGFSNVDTVRVYQHSAAGGGGTRQRLSSVTVHTSAGAQTFNNLPDQDVIDLNLGGVNTAFVLVDPVSQYNNAPDQQLGIREVELLSSTPAEFRATPNVALGKSVTLEGAGWCCGSAADITDGTTIWGPGLDATNTAVFNNALSAANGSWVIDLGQVTGINRIGLMQQTFGGGGARNMIEDLTLEFSNDNFANTLGSVDLVLQDGVIYQQLGFGPTAARYVRFNPTSQYALGSDPRIGIVEAQVFLAVPEPSTLMLGGLGLLVGLVGFRRRKK